MEEKARNIVNLIGKIAGIILAIVLIIFLIMKMTGKLDNKTAAVTEAVTTTAAETTTAPVTQTEIETETEAEAETTVEETTWDYGQPKPAIALTYEEMQEMQYHIDLFCYGVLDQCLYIDDYERAVDEFTANGQYGLADSFISFYNNIMCSFDHPVSEYYGSFRDNIVVIDNLDGTYTVECPVLFNGWNNQDQKECTWCRLSIIIDSTTKEAESFNFVIDELRTDYYNSNYNSDR